MKFLSTAVLLLSATVWVDSFVPSAIRHQQQQNVQRPSTTSSSWLSMATTPSNKEAEKILREEIAERNSRLENDKEYAVSEVTEDPSPTPVSHSKSNRALEEKLKRLTNTRAYPLFLAEKALEIIEGTLGGFYTGTSGQKDTSFTTGGTKEKIVILGTGWGAAAFLKGIDASHYDVTVISPRNYFLFTPMLAGSSVGTVDFRSITEPIREINRKTQFLEGTATALDAKAKTITCESVICQGNSCDIEDFTVEYDRLIITIGAQTNTYGIPGVREYCNFLKQVEDARRIRTAIINCFERANLPTLSDEERVKNLTFAVIGAGPTGIEFAAELRDFVEQDGPKYYPNLLKYVRIKIIEASSSVLAPFDKTLQAEAIVQLSRPSTIKDPDVQELLPPDFKLTELLLDSSVKEVSKKQIFLNDGSVIDYGLSVWAAGNGPLPLTLQMIEQLGEDQASEQSVARGRIATDPWMRAIGGTGSIFAFGDCSVTTTCQLPATAQVAAQQGEYLAKLMNKEYEFNPPLSEEGIFLPPTRNPNVPDKSLSTAVASFATQSNEYAKPFQFLNLGILAYTGDGTALSQVTAAPNLDPIKGTGKIGNAVWRSVYLSKQISPRNQLLVLNDWTKKLLFGRDITRL